ncbi:hypothetical protein ACIBKY_30450 [Nonomuraea sp. NPDC050394]
MAVDESTRVVIDVLTGVFPKIGTEVPAAESASGHACAALREGLR